MQFTLPDLHSLCPFPASTNPHYDKAGPESAAWVDEFNLLTGHKRAHFIRSKNELLASHTNPHAEYEEFRTGCDLINLLYVIDHFSDDQGGSDARATGKIFSNAMSDAPCDGSASSRMTKEFMARLFKKDGPYWKGRFIQHWIDYIDAVSTEAELRERGEVLDLQSYTRLRRENSGVRPCFGITEYVLGIDIPDEVFADPVFARMYWALTDIVCWSNDVYSYNMEQAMGHGSSNFLTVVMKEKNFTLQQASDHVGHVVEELMHQYLRDKPQLHLRWGPLIDDGVRRYITALESWVVGNLTWSFDSPRYFGEMHDEIRRTLTVTLKPRGTGYQNDLASPVGF